MAAYAEAKKGIQNLKKMLGMQEVRQTSQGRFHRVVLDLGWRTSLLELGKR